MNKIPIMTPLIVLKIIRATKWYLIFYLLLSAVASFVFVKSLPNLYASTSTYFPRDEITGGSNALQGLSGFVPGLGKNSGSINYIINIANSKDISKKVLHEVNLYPHLYKEHWDQQSQEWKTTNGVKFSPDTLLSIITFKSKYLKVESFTESGILAITTLAQDPHIALKLNQSFQKHLLLNLEQRTKEANFRKIQMNLDAINSITNLEHRNYLLKAVDKMAQEQLVKNDSPLEVIDKAEVFFNPVAPNKKLLFIGLLALATTLYLLIVPFFYLRKKQQL